MDNMDRLERRGNHKCTCINCASKIDAMELLFDFNPFFKSEYNDTARTTFSETRDGLKESINIIANKFAKIPEGPFKIKAEDFLTKYNDLFSYRVEDFKNDIFMALIKMSNMIRMEVFPDNSYASFEKEFKEIRRFSSRSISSDVAASVNECIDEMNAVIKNMYNSSGEDNKRTVLSLPNIAWLIISNEKKQYNLGETTKQNAYIYIRNEITELVAKKFKSLSGNYAENSIRPQMKIINELCRNDGLLRQIENLYEDNYSINQKLVYEKINIASTYNGFIKVGAIEFIDNSSPRLISRYCPYCNERVAGFACAYEEKVLTLIGNARVSKSTTIAAGLHYLRNQKFCDIRGDQGTQLDNGFGDSGNASWKEFEEYYLNCYARGRAVKATPTQSVSDIPRFSVIIKVGERNLILTVIDIPGEYFNNNNIENNRMIQSEYDRIYKNIDFLWLCLDYYELEAKTQADAERLSGNIGDGGYDPGHRIITHDENIARWDRDELTPMNKISRNENVCALFLVTKTDLYQGGERDTYKLYKEGVNVDLKCDRGVVNGRYYEEDIVYLEQYNMYNNMQHWQAFVKEEADRLHSMFCRKFKNRGFCCASAYGRKPDEEERGLGKAYMTGWPMIWLLIMSGYVNLSETKIKEEKKYGLSKLFSKSSSAPEKYNLYTDIKDVITKNNMTLQNDKFRFHD